MHDTVSQQATTARIDVDASTGGRRAIAGFLLQIVRCIVVGLEMSVTLTRIGDGFQMVLHLEPKDGGDQRITGGAQDIVEQVKMRTPRGRWSSGEVAAKVFPDLLRAVHQGRDQIFRFVTNNDAGLAPLTAYIAARRGAIPSTFRWGNERLSVEAFEARLAASAGLAGVTAEFRQLLDGFEIALIDLEREEQRIDDRLKPLLQAGEDPAAKRFEMLGRLMALSTSGARLTSEDLLAIVSPHAHRLLAHAQSLPRILASHLEADAVLVGYDHAFQARRAAPEISGDLIVLSGESGQGKTWTLGQLAYDQVAGGELALLMRAPASIAEIVGLVNERIWQPAYTDTVTLPVMADRLGASLRGRSGHWLTLYIDDVQNRDFAGALARYRWAAYGIRVVVSAQPRIGEMISGISKGTTIVDIGNFRSPDLRRFLKLHDRVEALETMPDDVFSLLAKPVHASIFIRLPKRATWAGVSEYELFSEYWRYAGLEMRSQPDHPSDQFCLTHLAHGLLSGAGHYPWTMDDAHDAGLSDRAILRLEEVGLLRRPTPDRMIFSEDRMLNWAIAEAAAHKVLDNALSPLDADALLASIDELKTASDEVLGSRLGYVFYDAMWLLAGKAKPEFLAEVMRIYLDRAPHNVRTEEEWANGFGSLGSRFIPVLGALAAHSFDETRDWDIPRLIPVALTSIAEADPAPVEAAIARGLASGNAQQVEIALRTARFVPAPSALDLIWLEHRVRWDSYEALRGADDGDARIAAIHEQELSSDALRKAISQRCEWLDRLLGLESEPAAVGQLLWALQDERFVDADDAYDIWVSHRERLAKILPPSSPALIAAIGHFREESLGTLLDAASTDCEDWTQDRVMRSRARLSADAALAKFTAGDEVYGWRAVNWWFDEIARKNPQGLARAIRSRARRSGDFLSEIALYYRMRPDAIDRATLDEFLDAFAEKLRDHNASNAAESEVGRLRHALDFLPMLSEPWQFEAMAERSGSALEAELVQFASQRRGRSSMDLDTVGGACERILAMIGGTGFADMIVAQLNRDNAFGRQDGYLAARWSDDVRVGAALSGANEEKDSQTFGLLVRMEAFAAHACDAQLEAMISSGTAVFVNAAQIRSSQGRDLDELRSRIKALLREGDEKSVETAAGLTGFLGEPEDAVPLISIFLDPATSDQVRHSIIASCRALGFYAPEMLAMAEVVIAGRIDERAQFIASYLARFGDAEARKVVAGWLENQDLGTSSASSRSFLPELVAHDDSRGAVVAYLRRSRASGHLVVDGEWLQLLAEAGDSWAIEELVRSAYRHTGFARVNVTSAIAYLRSEEPEEAYFAAQRLLSRQGQAAAVDLMLMIDPERAGSELLERYRTAKPLLRLQIARRLRHHLGGQALAHLIEPLARSSRSRDRLVAARLAAAVPSNVTLPWLEPLEADRTGSVRESAGKALRQRRRETIAMAQRELIAVSPKPVQWARLQRVLELVDPYFLWSRTDPTSLEGVFALLPHEFFVDAQQRRKRLLRERENAAERQDESS